MDGSKVWLRVDRVDAQWCDRARALSVADVHEAMGAAAGRAGLMSPRMRPLVRGLRVAGPALTAFCAPGDNLMMHRALSLAQPGDVLVVVCAAEASGAQIVHGCIRDTDMLESMRFPVWATAISPIHPDKSGHGFVNAPVACDGVTVYPGDLVLADGDGVVVVPRAHAQAVIEAAERRVQREDAFADSIAAGARPWELSGAADSYAKLQVEEIDAAWSPDPARPA
jgi:4-hydroxy-4-methyl-2-oxoglutarate aldolase